VVILAVLGIVLNVWVPFLFQIRGEKNTYCDIVREYSGIYFKITIAYIILTMLIPILIICVCNTLIIYFVFRANKKRQTLTNNKPIASPKKSYGMSENINLMSTMEMGSTAALDYTALNRNNKMTKSAKNRKSCPADSNKITRMLILMSFSYAILNLPYFVSWCLFFYQMGIKNNQSVIIKYHLFSLINLCEIFYVLNYGVHFFIYCASGKKFRELLRSAFTFNQQNQNKLRLSSTPSEMINANKIIK
jgi:cbb3-type cytochrome oxidase subunit 3